MEIRIKIPEFRVRKNLNSWWGRVIDSLIVEEQPKKQQVQVDNKKMKEEVNEFLASRQKLKDKKTRRARLEAVAKKRSNARIKLQKEDLRLSSMALIRYKKFLKENRQPEKAERAEQLDRMFFEAILAQDEQKQAKTDAKPQPAV